MKEPFPESSTQFSITLPMWGSGEEGQRAWGYTPCKDPRIPPRPLPPLTPLTGKGFFFRSSSKNSPANPAVAQGGRKRQNESRRKTEKNLFLLLPQEGACLLVLPHFLNKLWGPLKSNFLGLLEQSSRFFGFLGLNFSFHR